MTFSMVHLFQDPHMLSKTALQPPPVPQHIPETRPRSDSSYGSEDEDTFSTTSENSDTDTDEEGATKLVLGE